VTTWGALEARDCEPHPHKADWLAFSETSLKRKNSDARLLRLCRGHQLQKSISPLNEFIYTKDSESQQGEGSCSRRDRSAIGE